MTTARSPRLPARERRQAIVEAAVRVFANGSCARATTAEIARQAGVSEPILYRHFPSKRELYLACLDEAWKRLRALLEATFAEFEAAASRGERRMMPPFAWATPIVRRTKVLVPNLWLQAITEAGQDPEIERYVRAQMREVHDFVADAMRRAQAVGLVAADRDPEVEAWVTIAGGLLVSLGDRLGGLLANDDLAAISHQRQRWLFGLD